MPLHYSYYNIFISLCQELLAIFLKKKIIKKTRQVCCRGEQLKPRQAWRGNREHPCT